MYWDAYATLSGVVRLRRIVADAKDTGLTDDETQPITLRQARELLAERTDCRRGRRQARYEVQVYEPSSGWMPSGSPKDRLEADRLFASCTRRQAERDVRLVRLIPSVIAVKRGQR